MENFIVSIYPSAEGHYLTSYVHPITKKRIRTYFEKKSKAEDFKNQIENKFKKSKIAIYHDLFVEDLVIQFTNEQPKSKFGRMKRYSSDFTETFGHFKIEQLTSSALRTWLDQIQRENNLKEITMRGIKSDFEPFFNFLIQKEIISESPLAPIYYKKEAPEVFSRNILSEAEISMLLEEVKEFSPGYLYPMIKLFVETAIKPYELTELLWTQIDFNKKEVLIPRSVKNQERSLKISEELMEFFERRKKTSGVVFLTYYKEPFTKTKLARLINEFKIKTKSKIKWTPLDLRHSYAVNFLKSGGDIRTLQYLLGHNNVFDTKQLYGEVIKVKTQKTEVILNPFEMGS